MFGSFRVKHSLKTALAVVLAVILAIWFRWDKPYWSGVTVLIVMLPYIGASLEKSLLRLAGTWLGALAGVLVTSVFIQSPLPFTIVLAVMIISFVYLSGSNYAVIMGVGTMVIVIFSGLEDPTRIWHTGCYRCAEVTLGIVVGLFVNLSLWPRKASDELLESSRDILIELRGYYSTLVNYFMEEKDISGSGDIDLRRTGLLNRFSGLEVLLGYAVRESRVIRRERECYLSFILRLKELFVALSELRQCLEGEISEEYRAEFKPELSDFANAVLSEMDDLVAVLNGAKLKESSGFREELLKLRERLESLREKKVPARYPLQTSLRVMAFFSGQGDIEEALSGTRAALGHILGEDALPFPPPPALERKSAGFKLDPDRLKFAARIAVGLLAAIYGWWLFRWPSAMQTVVSFLVVIVQPRIGAANVKSLSRLSGALIGCFVALLSFIFILPHLESVWWFGLLLLVVIFISAFVHSGSPRYAYTGFQAGICFLLTVAQGYHQSFSIVPALDRVVGIMIGALLGAAVLRLIWPPSPRREFCRSLERLFGLYRETMEGAARTPPQTWIPRVLSDRSPVILDHCRIWLGRMRFFRPGERKKIEGLLRGLQLISFRLLSLFQARERLAGHPLVGNLESAREHLDRGLEEAFQWCREIFKEQEAAESFRGLGGERSELSEELRRLRRDGETWNVPTEDICRVGATAVAYENLVGGVEKCVGIIEDLDLKTWDPEIPI
jgi:p-hydroxybenzoic acid efflux pump subunit AaeB